MSVDVSKECDFINQAIKGGEVRSSLSGGIQKIADEVNKFENDTEQHQNDYENDLTQKENDFEKNVTNQQNNYESNLNTRQDEYESNINKSESIRIANENTRQENEDTRESNEVTRQGNETTRQTVYNEFRNFVNTAQQINRVPYLVDGGNLGDTSSTGLTLDGGDL